MLVVVLCNVDHIKADQETWGHVLGNQVLRAIASSPTAFFGDCCCGDPQRRQRICLMLIKDGSAFPLARFRSQNPLGCIGLKFKGAIAPLLPFYFIYPAKTRTPASCPGRCYKTRATPAAAHENYRWGQQP